MVSKTLEGLDPLPHRWLPPNPTKSNYNAILTCLGYLALLLLQNRVDKNNSNHLFCSQLCNLTRGHWRRLIAAVHGLYGQGSTKGWRGCFQDYSFTWLLAISWKLSRTPSSFGLRCDLCFLTAWWLSSRGKQPKKESQAEAVLPFVSSPGSYPGSFLSYFSFSTSQGSHKALSGFRERRHRLYLLIEGRGWQGSGRSYGMGHIVVAMFGI